MKGNFLGAVLVGFLFVLVYYVSQMMYGMYLTMNHAPNIAGQYESVEYLQNYVEFGGEKDSAWRMIEIPVFMLLGVITYLIIWKMKRK